MQTSMESYIETVLDALAVIRTVPLAANRNIFEVTESEPLHAADTNGISLLDARHLILLTVTFLDDSVQQPTQYDKDNLNGEADHFL